jgi:hypothetical protein
MVAADVMLETEHAVWTLMLSGDALRRVESDVAEADSATQLIDATSWYAGTRSCVVGIISCGARYQDAGVALVERYFRSRESVRIRSDGRAHLLANVRGVGSIHWTDLAAILRDCEQADVMTDIERALARNVVTWLHEVGIG